MNNFSDPWLQGIFNLFLVLDRLLKLPRREDIPFLNIYKAPGAEREDDWEAHVSNNKGRAWLITRLYPKGRERTHRTASKGRRWESKEGRHIDPRHERLKKEEASNIPEGYFWMRDKFVLEPACDGTKYTMYEYTLNRKQVSHNKKTQKTGLGPLQPDYAQPEYALCQIVANKNFGDEGPSSSSELPINMDLTDDINSSNNQLDQKMSGAISRKHKIAATMHKLGKRCPTETTEASTSRQLQEQVQVEVQNEFETNLPNINGNGLMFGKQSEISCVVPSNDNVFDDRGTNNHFNSESDMMYGSNTCLDEPNNFNWNSPRPMENDNQNINTVCGGTIDYATSLGTVDPFQYNFFERPYLEGLPLLEQVEDGNQKYFSAAGPNTSTFVNEPANVDLNPDNASWLEILEKTYNKMTPRGQGSLDLDLGRAEFN